MTLEYHNAHNRLHEEMHNNRIRLNSSPQKSFSSVIDMPVSAAKKRLIICCDGTWNEPSDSPVGQHSTNVFKLSQAIPAMDSQGIAQIVHYARGLGTGEGLSRLLGGAMGAGIDEEIQNAYLFLSMNYQPGDEIYLFGFSRGAYTVRSLAGFIYTAGLLKPQEMRCAAGVPKIDRIRLANRLEEAYQLYRSKGIKPSSPQAQEFRKSKQANFGQVPIQLLCCWDTVGSLGIPNLLPGIPLSHAFNQHYRFHDYKLCSKIKYALHAVALDEKRSSFDVTPMEVPVEQDSDLEQMLFPGGHGCVGGGTAATRQLSNSALQWVVDRIEQKPGLDLEIDITKMGEDIGNDGKLVIQALAPMTIPKSRLMKWIWNFLGLFSRGFKRQIPALSEEAIAWLARHSDYSQSELTWRQQQRLNLLEEGGGANAATSRLAIYDLHESTKSRLLEAQTDYEPDALGGYFEEVLGLERDRLFQAIQGKVAVTA